MIDSKVEFTTDYVWDKSGGLRPRLYLRVLWAQSNQSELAKINLPDEIRGVLLAGWQCSICNRVTICSEINQLAHDCDEVKAYRAANPKKALVEGAWVRIVSSPRPESQRFIGMIGQVRTVGPDQIAEVKFDKLQALLVDESMVEPCSPQIPESGKARAVRHVLQCCCKDGLDLDLLVKDVLRAVDGAL